MQEKRVSGWDDPRMPTLSGIRRRGFTPEAIRTFCAAIGATRTNGTTDIENARALSGDDLNRHANRAMAVLHPLKLMIDNYPAGQVETVEVANNPEDPSAGTRQVPFLRRESHIEQDDFREVPPPKYYRLSPGKEVRLRNAYFITAQSVVKDEGGNVVQVHCTYDPASRGGNSPRWPQGQVNHSLGLDLPTPSRPKFVSTTSSSPGPIPATSKKARASSTFSIPTRSRFSLAPGLSPLWPMANLRTDFQFEARRLLLPGSRLDRRKASIQPHPGPQRLTWAKIEKKSGV